MSDVLEVIAEPPQIDPTSAWRMFVDEARNSLGVGVGVGVFLKSPKGAIF